MKSTESLDVAGQPVDSPSTAGETGLLGDTSTLNNKRRRLIRGAVALAPVVLTLRSGALAAASCTGVKIKEVSVKSGDPRAGELLSSNIAAGDVCVEAGKLTECGTNPNKVETLSNLTQANSEPVKYRTPTSGTPYYTCGTNRDFQGQKVAILSSQSVISMVVT